MSLFEGATVYLPISINITPDYLPLSVLDECEIPKRRRLEQLWRGSVRIRSGSGAANSALVEKSIHRFRPDHRHSNRSLLISKLGLACGIILSSTSLSLNIPQAQRS
ncbi:hypothetical protein ABZX51_011468 [Aspergillus tubingensis]